MELIKYNFKAKINLQNILYFYIIICPILDCMSFIFRNKFNTNISPSTIIRPIIVGIACLYIFIKDKKQRKIFVLAGLTYSIYAIVHLYIFEQVKNGSSYSGIIHEIQYLVNYTFMVLNLYVYIYTFGKLKDTLKLSKCILISISIYILTIYISIITGTSSYTYPGEMVGFKGWFESGNSLSAICILSMFIIINIFNKKDIDRKIKIWTSIITILTGLYLMLLIGTRVGLFGYAIVIGLAILIQLIYNLIHKNKVKETLILVGVLFVAGIVSMILVFKIIGSKTLERRQIVQELAEQIIDNNQVAHITGDMVKIKKDIQNENISEDYMSKAQQNALIKLDEIATKYNLSVEKMRILQLIYNYELIKEQSNPIYVLFGNGYMSQYREMILEMEIPAFLLNFGIYGFIIYLVPFIIVFVYAGIKILKNIKKIDVEDVMLLFGGAFAFALSFLTGYIFFNASTTMIIIVIETMLFIKAKEK